MLAMAFPRHPPSPPHPTPPQPPPPAPLDWLLYTLGIGHTLTGTIYKKGLPPSVLTNQLPPHSLPFHPFRFIPKAIHLLSLFVAKVRDSHYTLLGPSKGFFVCFFEKYIYKRYHRTTDLALKLAKASGLCRPL